MLATAFALPAEASASLMFHNSKTIPGGFPYLEGESDEGRN